MPNARDMDAAANGYTKEVIEYLNRFEGWKLDDFFKALGVMPNIKKSELPKVVEALILKEKKDGLLWQNG